MPTLNRKPMGNEKMKTVTVPNTDIDYAKYYNSSVWYKLRNHYFRLHPLCEECLKKGKVVQAVDVHHIIPFSKGITEAQRWELLTDEDNLESLCSQCHAEAHKKLRCKH